MNVRYLKLGSLVATGSLTIAAVIVGGGAPPDPARLARVASAAADNAAEAADNIAVARRDTEALATISDNVLRQLDASRRLLKVQLEIEESSRSSADASGALGTNIRGLKETLTNLKKRLETLSLLAGDAGDQSRAAAAGARTLRASLDELKRRYDRLIEESRELNRKARGYAELKDGPS